MEIDEMNEERSLPDYYSVMKSQNPSLDLSSVWPSTRYRQCFRQATTFFLFKKTSNFRQLSEAVDHGGGIPPVVKQHSTV
jgi:hypothetical protein